MKQYVKENNQLVIYIFNVDFAEIADMMCQFGVAKILSPYSYGYGNSKKQAKKDAEMNLVKSDIYK